MAQIFKCGYVMKLAFTFTNLDMKMSEAKTARFISPPGIPNKNGVRDQTVSNTSLYLEQSFHCMFLLLIVSLFGTDSGEPLL